jgi:ADP-heptose:LPS heptosyltransferase
MPLDPSAARSVERRLRDAGVPRGAALIVVHVSAGNPFRRWPLDSFVALICRLAAANPDRRIVLTSGPSDAAAAEHVALRARSQLTPAQRSAIVEAGEFSLAELRALMDRASVYIGGDSGPLHIAGTTQIPIVGLYGPTLPVRSQAWRNPVFISEAAEVSGLPCRPCNQRRCAPGDFRCLTRISADVVANLTEHVMEATTPR